MTPSERIELVIQTLAHGSAAEFCEKTGIHKSKASYLRHALPGAKPEGYYARILAAYPEINREWLVFGEGRPFATMTMEDYRLENERLWGLVKQMEKNLAQYAKIVERYEKELGKNKSAEKSAERG